MYTITKSLQTFGNKSQIFKFFSTNIISEVKNLIKKDKIVVFMKGTPEVPQCDYTKTVVNILGTHGVKYNHYDILNDPDLRQGVKMYSKCPNLPQVYINGQFIGGCEELLTMHENGDLAKELEKIGITSMLIDSGVPEELKEIS